MTHIKYHFHCIKFIFIVFLFLGINFKVLAQFDSEKKSKLFAAPIMPSKKPAAKLPNQPFNFDFKKPPTNSTLFPDPKAPKPQIVDLVKINKFENPNDLILKQLNKPESQQEQDFKADNYFGDFRNNGKNVKIVCRDYGEIDGDLVRVYLNDKIVISEIYLDSNFKEVLINLTAGFNKIEFQALNQGSSGPNTAEFIMFDDKGIVISSNRWNLTTGAKAKIIVTKE